MQHLAFFATFVLGLLHFASFFLLLLTLMSVLLYLAFCPVLTSLANFIQVAENSSFTLCSAEKANSPIIYNSKEHSLQLMQLRGSDS